MSRKVSRARRFMNDVYININYICIYIFTYIRIYIYIYVCVCVCLCVYRSPNIVREIKSRRLKWAGHVARMEEFRSAFKILLCKPTGRDNYGSLDVYGRTILEWTLKR